MSMTKSSATRWQKTKAFILGMIIVDLQTVAAAWVLMMLIGIVHHNLIPALEPANFFTCVVILFMVQIFHVLSKFTIDFR